MGPKVDRSANGTVWGAKRLCVYVLYDHFPDNDEAIAPPLPTSTAHCCSMVSVSSGTEYFFDMEFGSFAFAFPCKCGLSPPGKENKTVFRKKVTGSVTLTLLTPQ